MSRHRCCLLVVDSDHLTRWSIRAYFKDRFDVFCTDSVRETKHVLDERSPDAIILSDDLPAGESDEIENYARKKDAAVRVIRTVTFVNHARGPDRRKLRLEKPFALATLATLLDAPAEDARDDEDRPCS